MNPINTDADRILTLLAESLTALQKLDGAAALIAMKAANASADRLLEEQRKRPGTSHE